MRDWIKLFENHIPWLDDEPDLVQKFTHEHERREDVGDGQIATYTQSIDEISYIQKKLKAYISSGKIMVWRSMVLKPFFIKRLQPNTKLGVCWAFEKEYARTYNVSEKNLSDTYKFEAIVDVKNVDWLTTIVLQQFGENEIRLKDNVEIILSDIKNYEGQSFRADLFGEIFLT